MFGVCLCCNLLTKRSLWITPLKSPKLSWNVLSRLRLMKECLWQISSEEAA